jgi:ParB-like chromosome segregation protein Spo0J
MVERHEGPATQLMMKKQAIPIAEIYVPTKRRSSLDLERVQAIADSILSEGLKMPILVREDGSRYVLVEGHHRLEACRALGEATIDAYLVQSRRH